MLADTKIHILGSFQNIRAARDSICALILGSPAGKVYSKVRRGGWDGRRPGCGAGARVEWAGVPTRVGAWGAVLLHACGHRMGMVWTGPRLGPACAGGEIQTHPLLPVRPECLACARVLLKPLPVLPLRCLQLHSVTARLSQSY